MAATHDARAVRKTARWLVGSREHTNLTYDLTPLNREHLAWWVAEVTGATVRDARVLFDEIEQDTALMHYLSTAVANSERRRLMDPPRYGKRIAWYALVRLLRPSLVVETGTDKGLGSVVFAAALLRNGAGRLVTIDVNDFAGSLIGGPYAAVVDVRVGDAVAEVGEITEPIDVFLHDSLHTDEHETAEYTVAGPRLSESGVVLSDNAHVTTALPRWAEQHDRRYLHFQEQPADHWYPGGATGASVSR